MNIFSNEKSEPLLQHFTTLWAGSLFRLEFRQYVVRWCYLKYQRIKLHPPDSRGKQFLKVLPKAIRDRLSLQLKIETPIVAITKDNRYNKNKKTLIFVEKKL